MSSERAPSARRHVPVDHRVYAILDPARTRDRDLATLADAAVRGGATLLQYRDKSSETRVMITRARAIVGAVGGRIPVLVNDRVDVALAAGADGVHVGRDDMAPTDARRLLGQGAIVGITIKDADDLAGLDPALVDYGTIGSVFPTASKDLADPPIGLDGLARLGKAATARAALPVGAIAGIDAGNAAAVIAAGADGIAVIGAIFMADDPVAATADLRRIVDAATGRRAP